MTKMNISSRCMSITAFAILIFAFLAAPARAAITSITEIDLQISFIPGDPCFGVSSTSCHLEGIAQFYIPSSPVVVSFQPLGAPIDIGDLSAGSGFFTSFIPGDPCVTGGTCEVSFSFGGSFAAFPAFAFGAGNIPGAVPSGPPILPVGMFLGSPLVLTGPIVAYDDPVTVGSYTVTIHATPEPAGGCMLVFALVTAMLVVRRQRMMMNLSLKPLPLVTVRPGVLSDRGSVG